MDSSSSTQSHLTINQLLDAPSLYFHVLPRDVRLYALDFIRARRGLINDPAALRFDGYVGPPLYTEFTPRADLTSVTCSPRGDGFLTVLRHSLSVLRCSADVEYIALPSDVLPGVHPVAAVETRDGFIYGIVSGRRGAQNENQCWLGCGKHYASGSIALNPSETRLYVSLPGTELVKIYDLPYTDKPAHTFKMTHIAQSLVVLSDDTVVVSSGNGVGFVTHYSCAGDVLASLRIHAYPSSLSVCYLAVDAADTVFFYCNLTDRILFSRRPYSVLEGIAAGAWPHKPLSSVTGLAVGLDGALILGEQRGRLLRYIMKK